jgi:hypothetical protein
MPPVTDLNLLRHTPAKYQRPHRVAPPVAKPARVWTLDALFRALRSVRLIAARA